jgi:hypothetical protein
VDETIGLVTPGQWIDFFRFLSESYSGAFAPQSDNRMTISVLAPKFPEIKEKYDVIFQPAHQGGELADWSDKDRILPDGTEPYYLQANRGPRYLLGGVLARPFITTKQSDGKFAIASIESSSILAESVLASPFALSKVHQVYHFLDGAVSIELEGQENVVRAGETLFIPAGTRVAVRFVDRFVRFWSFSSGDGLETLIAEAGGAFNGVVVPDEALPVDADKVAEVAARIHMELR